MKHEQGDNFRDKTEEMLGSFLLFSKPYNLNAIFKVEFCSMLAKFDLMLQLSCCWATEQLCQ